MVVEVIRWIVWWFIGLTRHRYRFKYDGVYEYFSCEPEDAMRRYRNFFEILDRKKRDLAELREFLDNDLIEDLGKFEGGV